MDEKFVLVRKVPEYNQQDPYPKIRVKPRTYQQLAAWSALTGKALSELCYEAVEFAARNQVVVNELPPEE